MNIAKIIALAKLSKNGGSGVPECSTPYQQLVTDENCAAKWEDRTHYESGLITAKLNSNDGLDSGEGYQYGRYRADNSNVTNPDTKTALCAMGDDIWAYLNEVWADSSKRRRLVFYWDGVRVEPPAPVFRLPYIYNGLNDNLPYIEIFQHGSMAKVRVGYHEAGEHTFSYEARNYQLKQLDEDFIPTTVPVIQSAQVGQTVVVKAVDENGKPTEWEAVDSTSSNYEFWTDDGVSVMCVREVDWDMFEFYFLYGSPVTLTNNHKKGTTYRATAYIAQDRTICFGYANDSPAITIDRDTNAFILTTVGAVSQ